MRSPEFSTLIEQKLASTLLAAAGTLIALACAPFHPSSADIQKEKSTTPPITTPVSKAGVFSVGERRITWNNPTLTDFNPQAATAVYQALQTFGQRRRIFDTQMFESATSNEFISVLVVSKPAKGVQLHLIPAKSPDPFRGGWGDSGVRETEGLVEGFARVYIAAAELPPAISEYTPQGISNDNFYRQACVSTLNFLYSPPVILKAPEKVVERTAVDFACNKLAMALSIRREGILYDEYAQGIARNRFVPPSPTRLAYTLSELPQDEFNMLPSTPPISLRNSKPPLP